MLRCLTCSVFLLALYATGFSADLYVSSNGDDASSGAKNEPIASLAAARDAARAYAGKEAVTIHVDDGVYYLPETLVFTAQDSGTKQFPVTYKAVNEGDAVLSGGSKLQLTWSAYKDGVFQAKTPAGLNVDQLFINGKNQRMARYPNYDADKKAQPYQGFSSDAFSKKRAASWADPSGGYIHALHRSRWGGYHYRITGKKANGEVNYEGGWQNNRQMGMHKDFRMVENIFEELDAPSEWFHNPKSNTLYYKPAAGVDLNSAVVEVVRLRHLVEFEGTESAPVKHIHLRGFVVRHAARTFMDTKEQMVRSDWAIYRGGAFLLTGTEDVQIHDCEFDQVGGNAIFVNNYNRRTLVKGCHIHDPGASGVCFIGDPKAARDPLFEYHQKNDLDKIDRTVGPKTNNYPSLGVVEDCLIHGVGRTERQPAGVTMDLAMKITVRDTSVYDCARSGINIGDGAWGGHLIDRCDVFDTVLETHDHGSFNSWGRDRFWHSDRSESQRVIDKDPTLPFLDAMHTTTIRNSRWRCDHGWDIDLDDGSTNYEIYNNLMLGSGLKLREGFRRRAWNNIATQGSLHPHVWYNRSGDEVHHNIFMLPHKPARMSRPYTDEVRVDENFFGAAEAAVMKNSSKLGWDKNSAFGDPMFIDPTKGDFRVKENSPALALGFKNFPMDQFGVKKPALKAIARKPDFSDQSSPTKHGGEPDAKGRPAKRMWLGAVLQDLNGDEFSAYGVSKDDGGVVLQNIDKNSAAAKAGITAGDVVQAVNGKQVSKITELLKTLSSVNSESVRLKIVRDQKAIEVSVELPSIAIIETASAQSGFVKLPVPPVSNRRASKRKMTANQRTSNDPISTLTDGKLDTGFGPVFSNGIQNGAYKMDLGSVQSVSTVTSWSYNVGGVRGAQQVMVHGSNSVTDPGWDLKAFTQLGTIATTRTKKAEFTAASLRTPSGKPLGNFRWIVWSVSPVTTTGGGENTAFQEFAVEINP